MDSIIIICGQMRIVERRGAANIPPRGRTQDLFAPQIPKEIGSVVHDGIDPSHSQSVENGWPDFGPATIVVIARVVQELGVRFSINYRSH